MKDIDFEKRLENAKEILERLNDPKIKLDDSIKLYKDGKEILKEASEILQKAKLELEEYNKEDIE
jgi:exodeoxyribonuclease VII small subunit